MPSHEHTARVASIVIAARKDSKQLLNERARALWPIIMAGHASPWDHPDCYFDPHKARSKFRKLTSRIMAALGEL